VCLTNEGHQPVETPDRYVERRERPVHHQGKSAVSSALDTSSLCGSVPLTSEPTSANEVLGSMQQGLSLVDSKLTARSPEPALCIQPRPLHSSSGDLLAPPESNFSGLRSQQALRWQTRLRSALPWRRPTRPERKSSPPKRQVSVLRIPIQASQGQSICIAGYAQAQGLLSPQRRCCWHE
jgi:hypothetical protein